MSKICILICLIVFVSTGCGSTSMVPYGKAGADVKNIGENEYIFYFKKRDIDPLASDREQALNKFFVIHPELLPPNCTKGIKLNKGGNAEGGNGWAEFSCH